MAEARDYYAILQVNRRASGDEIERAYERLSKLYDPAISKKRRASERWEQISEAYEVLSDPAKRAEYDRGAAPRRIPSFGGGESAVTRFVASRWGLPSLAALIGSIVIIAVTVSVLGGSGDDNAVADITTPAPLPTEAPTPSPVTTIPPLTDEGVTTDSGLQIITVEEGAGDSPVLGDSVVVHYTGWTETDGAKFDSSVDRGSPSTFTLGSVIEGWNEGLALMKEGGKARLIIPGDLGYGEGGNPGAGIGPNATLIFDVELIDVIKPGETPMPTASPTVAPSPTATSEASDEASGTPEPTT